LARHLGEGRAFYLWGGNHDAANHRCLGVLYDARLYVAQALIWAKSQVVSRDNGFASGYEVGFYGWRDGAPPRVWVPAGASALWTCAKEPPRDLDCADRERPVELAVRAIEYSTAPGETVLDLAAGFGSTLIAAVQTGRRARLVERDPISC